MTLPAFLRHGRLHEAGGWRRFFIAGTLPLFLAALVLGWQIMGEDPMQWDTLGLALFLWSLGALALALLTLSLSLLDAACIWVGKGFGLKPAASRIGLCAVLAGLTFIAAAAAWLRYETVMSAGGSSNLEGPCVVLDRWTGEAKSCRGEGMRYRQPELQHAQVRQGGGEACAPFRLVNGKS